MLQTLWLGGALAGSVEAPPQVKAQPEGLVAFDAAGDRLSPGEFAGAIDDQPTLALYRMRVRRNAGLAVGFGAAGGAMLGAGLLTASLGALTLNDGPLVGGLVVAGSGAAIGLGSVALYARSRQITGALETWYEPADLEPWMAEPEGPLRPPSPVRKRRPVLTMAGWVSAGTGSLLIVLGASELDRALLLSGLACGVAGGVMLGRAYRVHLAVGPGSLLVAGRF